MGNYRIINVLDNYKINHDKNIKIVFKHNTLF